MAGIYTKGKKSEESPPKLWDLTNVKPFSDTLDQHEGHYVFENGINTENIYKNEPVPEAATYTGNSSGTFECSQIADSSTTWYTIENVEKIQQEIVQGSLPHNPEDLVEFKTVCIPPNLESGNSLSTAIDEVFGDDGTSQGVVYRAHWHCNRCHAHGTIWAIKKRGIYKCTQCGNFTESVFIEDKSNGDEEIGHYDNIW